MDINPLVVFPKGDGAIAIDVRIAVNASAGEKGN
ncbi:acetate--CoA ligase family protein [Candidatus Kuenenia stuttgartiensis]|nr:acetate--CoA ligase family protein [Candidatus Kuenenia stuttgartiensis]